MNEVLEQASRRQSREAEGCFVKVDLGQVPSAIVYEIGLQVYSFEDRKSTKLYISYDDYI